MRQFPLKINYNSEDKQTNKLKKKILSIKYLSCRMAKIPHNVKEIPSLRQKASSFQFPKTEIPFNIILEIHIEINRPTNWQI